MTWTNKKLTKWLDLERISYWHYNSQESQEEELEEFRKCHGNMFSTSSTLIVIVDGAKLEFEGNEADEIYKLLSGNKKKLLKG